MGAPGSPRRGGGAASPSKKKKQSGGGLCSEPKVNSLWSVWYCTLAVAFQLYIVASSIKRFGRYIALPWPLHDQPYLELNAYVGFLGASIVLMPFFIATAMLRIGNYPNDGTKVHSKPSPAGTSPDSVVYQNVRTASKGGQWARAVWRHGGPTAPFLHVASAFCLLLPRVFIQAQLIKHGFLKKSDLWSSELDFVIAHKDRLVSLSFLSTINETELWDRQLREVQQHTPGTSHPQAQLQEDAVAVSAEFINFGVSLVVYAVRYPSVFWESSKAFGLLFSLQLLLNGMQQLLAFTGFGVLYKVHVFGPEEALVRFSPLLLDVSTTVILFLLYNMAMTASSCTLYCYGLQKHREWMDRRLQRHHITWGRERWRLWGYTPHVSAFVVLLLLASTAAPIAYDFTLVYCGSLDGAVLAAVTSTVTHLFLWIVLWLFLTVKQRWRFIDDAGSPGTGDPATATCNGHVSRGMGESDLTKFRQGTRGEAPLLVIDSGHTYQIRERASRKAILNLAHRSILRQKHSSSTDDEDIYWLKPRPPSPKEHAEALEDERSSTWLRSQKRSPGSKHKVTFEEALLNASPTRRKSTSKSPKHVAKTKKPNVKFEDFSESGSEDGDYATLTDLPGDDCDGDHVHRSLCPLGGAEVADLERTVRLEGAEDDDYDLIVERVLTRCSTAPVSMGRCGGSFLLPPDAANGGNTTPRSTRSTDSGASKGSSGVTEHQQPRSDSASETSTSPEKGGGGGSDTSSGVHSGGGSSFGGEKRASSLENVALEVASPTWRSMSLQRGVMPPHGADPTLYYDPRETTILIWRKSKGQTTPPTPVVTSHQKQDQFGRATNMRMTSFSEKPGYGSVVATPPISPQHAQCQVLPSGSPGHYGNVAALPVAQLQSPPHYPIVPPKVSYVPHC